MNKICVICGKEFAQHGSAITCGKECSLINKKKNRRRSDELYKERQRIMRGRKISSVPGIVEISKKARELGMSYGEYVAYMESEKQCQK